MATKSMSGGKMPEGFTSPFKRVPMEERNDDALACIATLSGRTLADVTKVAVSLGYPERGPAWVDNQLITRVLNALGLIGGEYQEAPSIDALPYVAILMVDYDPKTEIGRHVVWHHVKGSANTPSWSYVVDVANWIDPSKHVTTDFKHMKMTPPLYYVEITQKASPKGK
jgi:hypothetical protein